MAFGCVEKKTDKDGVKSYCGETIPSSYFYFTHAQRAAQHYDSTSVRNPDMRRLWACKGCVKAIKKEHEESASEGFGALIAADKSRT